MSARLDRLHPVVVHHIVNTLGWSSLRALQEEAAGPVLDGTDALLLAPTAGGKSLEMNNTLNWVRGPG